MTRAAAASPLLDLLPLRGSPQDLAALKRLFDRWMVEPDVRARLERGDVPDLPAPADSLRRFWDPRAVCPPRPEEPPVVHDYHEYLRLRARHRDHMRRECAPSSRPLGAWRRRQMLRCADELPASFQHASLHLSVAFELCQGCSVGCSFCGLSAPKLEDVFRATPDNRRLWREVLAATRNVLGEAASRGVCFWATDPLDNPDYETLCDDFHHVLGRFPPTTTALADRDPGRARALLERSWERGCEFNRFSVLTVRALHKIHDAIPAQDMLFVDVIPQNKGAFHPKINAGRALDGDGVPATIACVSGFLVNMPRRTVRLVSPCRADARWPLGYRVHAEAAFADARRLEGTMRDVIDRHTQLSHSTPIRVRPGRQAPLLLHEGETASEVALRLERDGVPLASTLHRLSQWMDDAILDDSPGASQTCQT